MLTIFEAVQIYDPGAMMAIRPSEEGPWGLEVDPDAWLPGENGRPAPTVEQLQFTLNDLDTPILLKKFGPSFGIDYLNIRERIKVLYQTIGFPGLAPEDQEVCAEMFLLEDAELVTLNLPQQYVLQLSKEYRLASVKCRENRIAYIELIIFNSLVKPQYLVVLDAMDKTMISLYNSYGITGQVDGFPQVGLADFFLSHPGTRYEGAGFLQTGVEVKPGLGTLSDMRDTIIGILNNGVSNA